MHHPQTGDLFSRLAEKYGVSRSDVNTICLPVLYGTPLSDVETACEQAVRTTLNLDHTKCPKSS